MLRRSIPSTILAFLLAVSGLALFIPAGLPFPELKSLLDGMGRDGNFNSLKPWNAGVFQLLFGAAGCLGLIFAGLTFFHGWKAIGHFLKNLWSDAGSFLRAHWPKKGELGFLVVLAFIMVLGVIYRLEHAVSSMKPDEAYTYVVFSRSFFSAISDYHLPNNHIFHSILVYFSTRIFGPQPWAVRLPAFTAGVLLVPAVYWMAKRFYDQWTALGAAFLTAWFPTLIAYSNNARGYTLVALFSVLCVALGEVVRREKNTFVWALISLFSALGLYTVPVMLFPFGILFAWLFLENFSGDVVTGENSYRSKRQFLYFWGTSGIGTGLLTGLFYLPVLIYTGSQKIFSNVYVAPLSWKDLLEELSARFYWTWIEWSDRVPLIFLLLLGAGLVLGLVLHRRLSKVKIPLQLAAILWITTLILIQRPNAGSKVWVFLVPLLLTWVSAGLFGVLQKIRPRFSRGRPILMAALAVILLVGSRQAGLLVPQLQELWSKQGIEEKTVLLVRDQLQEDELIAVAPALDASIWYYSELHGIPDAYFNSRSSDYKRLIVIVHLTEDQTLDSVILNRGFHLKDLDLGSAKLLGTFGSLQIFEVPRK